MEQEFFFAKFSKKSTTEKDSNISNETIICSSNLLLLGKDEVENQIKKSGRKSFYSSDFETQDFEIKVLSTSREIDDYLILEDYDKFTACANDHSTVMATSPKSMKIFFEKLNNNISGKCS